MLAYILKRKQKENIKWRHTGHALYCTVLYLKQKCKILTAQNVHSTILLTVKSFQFLPLGSTETIFLATSLTDHMNPLSCMD